MVSSSHEAMHRVFQRDPGIFGRTFRRFGVPFADPVQVTLLPTDLTETEPLERRVDTLLRFDGPAGESALLLVEAQSRRDPGKVSSWTYYAAHLFAKYDSPPLLLVVCQDKSTAKWAEGPFRIGPEHWPTLELRPVVAGPHNMPFLTDPATAAEDIPLAVLSAITHGKDPDVGGILEALAVALKTVDEDTANTFANLTALGLAKSPAIHIWRDLVTVKLSFFNSPFAAELRAEGEAAGRAEGEAAGRAKDILRLLDQRGIEVSETARQRITTCSDVHVLDAWFSRILTAATTDELFGHEENNHQDA